MYHMPLRHKTVCLVTILSIYVLLLSLSCFFYILVLRRRGQFGINQVEVSAEAPTEESSKDLSANNFGGIWTGLPTIAGPDNRVKNFMMGPWFFFG